MLDNFSDTFVLKVDDAFSSTFFDLQRDEVVSSDIKFLFSSVPWNFDKFKSVEERTSHL